MAGTILTRILDDGSKSYDCRIRVNGKQKSKTFKLRRDADQYIAKSSTDRYEGIYKPLKKIRFEDFVAQWKAAQLIPEKLKPSTINGYASNIETHILPAFKGYQMTAIDETDIVELETRLLRQGLSIRSVRGALRLLARIFSAARRQNYVRVSPMLDMEKTKLDKTRHGRALKADEIEQLLKHCDEKLKTVVLIALLAGLRRGEIFALHWTEDKDRERSFIDFDNDVIRVRQSIFFRYGKYQTRAEGEPVWVLQKPKSERSIRPVPLSPALKRELKSWFLKAEDKQGLIFQTSNGTPMDADNVCRRKPKLDAEAPPKAKGMESGKKVMLPRANFSAAVEQAGLGKLRFHDLRHTYGSWKVDQGENIYDVQQWMGHSSIQVTIDVYGHPVTDRGQEAARKTDELFGLACNKPKR